MIMLTSTKGCPKRAVDLVRSLLICGSCLLLLLSCGGSSRRPAERYFELGVTESNMGNNREAIHYYSLCIEADSSAWVAFHNRGCMYLELCDYDSAFVDFSRAVTMAPNDPDIHIGLGRCLEWSGNLVSALAEYKHASLLDPTDPGPRTNQAVILIQRDSFDTAREILRDVLASNPTSVLALDNLAVIEQNIGSPDSALAFVMAAIAQDSSCIECYHTLATTYELMGRPVDAADAVRLLISHVDRNTCRDIDSLQQRLADLRRRE